MEIKVKPQTKLWAKRIVLYVSLFMGGLYAPEIHKMMIHVGGWYKPELNHRAQAPAVVPIEHTVHTAKLGVPTLKEFAYDCAMYEYYDKTRGRHLRYPLTFTCGCVHKKQQGLSDISYPNLEGKVYQVQHTPITSKHENLWFMQAEVKAPEAPAAVAAPETNGN